MIYISRRESVLDSAVKFRCRCFRYPFGRRLPPIKGGAGAQLQGAERRGRETTTTILYTAELIHFLRLICLFIKKGTLLPPSGVNVFFDVSFIIFSSRTVPAFPASVHSPIYTRPQSASSSQTRRASPQSSQSHPPPLHQLVRHFMPTASSPLGITAVILGF